MNHTSPEKEVSQEQETVDDKLSKPDNSYIDQVAHPTLKDRLVELRNEIMSYLEHNVDVQFGYGQNVLEAGDSDDWAAVIDQNLETAQGLGKTAERQRIREIVENYTGGFEHAMSAKYPKCVVNIMAADLLSRLDV